MKKIRISESELIDLIEKLVKENIGGNTGFDFMLGTPTSKYKDLYEDEDVESEEELDEDEFNVDSAQTGDKTLTLNTMKQTNMSDWMGEGKITESQLVRRLSRKLNEDNWMQKADDDIERRGTEGVFHRYCVDKGYKDGCSPGCWEHAEDAIADGKLDGGLWGRRIGLAKAYCGAQHESVPSQGKLITEKKKKKKKTGKCPESGCITKRGKSWRIISNRTGKLWKAKYDTRKDAEDGLEAYHANR
jgi:hypothetical protein